MPMPDNRIVFDEESNYLDARRIYICLAVIAKFREASKAPLASDEGPKVPPRSNTITRRSAYYRWAGAQVLIRLVAHVAHGCSDWSTLAVPRCLQRHDELCHHELCHHELCHRTQKPATAARGMLNTAADNSP
jgi:hypothetical protein